MMGVSSSTVWAGVPLTYTLVVTNRGPPKAPHVVQTDILPAGAMYVRDNGGCSLMEGVLSCDLGTLSAGEAGSLEQLVHTKDPGAGLSHLFSDHEPVIPSKVVSLTHDTSD